ncbi:hypothetical protein JOC94_004240 [Bacillus thermophilus]|uniref:Uncharacterized protein n=1 Tax=Siminovitchia thermophila TaxID=1245522 RepID=A0ABS2RCV8_9BACI|nr:hypothetical protein [Siminovitchia thermophila]MBM7717215.1 hypothetical protein [Siminovitchia thermophila]
MTTLLLLNSKELDAQSEGAGFVKRKMAAEEQVGRLLMYRPGLPKQDEEVVLAAEVLK